MAYKDDTEAPPQATERGPRPDEGKMPDDEFRALIKALVEESTDYIDSDLQQDRVDATDYFHGRPLGNEKDGRSKVVITEVRDKILGIMPDLMALFFGPDRAVEYVPTSAAKVDAADQITEYVRKVVIETDNPGFMHFHSALLDGLVRKLGTFKWWWDDSTETSVGQRLGAPPEEMELLISDGAEIVEGSVKQSDLGPGLYDFEFKRTDKTGKARFATVPPEEVIFLRDTRTPEDALFFGHRMEKTRGELLALGISEKLIEEHGGGDPELDADELNLARNPAATTDGEAPQDDEANTKILYIEGYTRLDYDGDGIAELRKVCTIGPGFYPTIPGGEPVDEVPFAVFTPIPEPHTLVGQSYADLTKDIQRIKSAVTRGILDSLSTAIFPRTWYKEQDANLADVMSTEIGAPIRTRTGANAVGVFQHAFVGKDAFPLLEYFDQVSENRTGHSKGAEGLDADALQSTTKSGVDAAVTGSRSQTEMVARIFAENALKPLFRGLYRLIVNHQPKARMVRLREQWVEVDPRTWDADLDVQVNVGLGQAPREQKMAVLAGIKQTQEQLLQLLGPDNPVVGLGQYRYTLGKLTELAGFADSTRFFKPLPLDWTPPPPPPQAQQPDPALLMVQVEQQKAQAQAAAKQQELQLKAQSEMQGSMLEQQKLEVEMQMNRERLAAEMALKERELRMKYVMEARKQDMQAAVAFEKMSAEVDAEAIRADADERQAEADRAEESSHRDADRAVQAVQQDADREVQQAQADADREAGASDLSQIVKETQAMVEQLAQKMADAPTPVSPPAEPKRGGKRKITFENDANGNVIGAIVEDLVEQAAQQEGLL